MFTVMSLFILVIVSRGFQVENLRGCRQVKRRYQSDCDRGIGTKSCEFPSHQQKSTRKVLRSDDGKCCSGQNFIFYFIKNEEIN
jgi:hypothetical protein